VDGREVGRGSEGVKGEGGWAQRKGFRKRSRRGCCFGLGSGFLIEVFKVPLSATTRDSEGLPSDTGWVKSDEEEVKTSSWVESGSEVV
jgi:hypothetical protein